jgi:hypothetical protein
MGVYSTINLYWGGFDIGFTCCFLTSFATEICHFGGSVLFSDTATWEYMRMDNFNEDYGMDILVKKK